MDIKIFWSKSVAKFLVFATLISLFSFYSTGVSSAYGYGFSDMREDEMSYKAVYFLANEGVVKGYSDGSFGVNKDINRAEFLKIVMEAKDKVLDKEQSSGGGAPVSTKKDSDTTAWEGSNCYSDVKDEWFAPYICSATTSGWVNGYKDGTFRPADTINFAEASKIISNVLGLDISAGTSANWYEGYVDALSSKEAIPSTVTAFDDKLTRGDMAEIIWRTSDDVTYKVSNSYDSLASGNLVSESTAGLQKFESCSEMRKYMEDSSYNLSPDVLYMDSMAKEAAPMAGEAVSDSAAPGGGAEMGAAKGVEHSETNVQVSGVDEADIVKNDGQYVYTLKGNTVRIVDAYPPNSMKELTKVTVADQNFYPSEMYVDDDRLVVVGTSYNGNVFLEGKSGGTFISDTITLSGSLTKVYVFDITDKTKVKQIRELSFEGNYNSSRKIGNNVYLVANQYMYYLPWGYAENAKNEGVVPYYADSKDGKISPVTGCSDVYYVPGHTSMNYAIVAGIPVDDATKSVSKQVIMGSSSNIYASTDNLYLAEPRYSNYGWWLDSVSDEETYLYKFSLSGSLVKYQGSGTVPGTILNQFSMDESGDYFRIATTKGDTESENNKSQNNVYVLDGDMNTVGALTGLAKGERIYSTRFVGNRLYMVTFKNTDPLFVIGLDDPKSPKVLGKLKIPGYSDYLHPYDETHIIGFGKEAVDAEGGMGWMGDNFAWYQGMKVAMFDVSDTEHPTEMFKITIGDRGTSSPLLYDHKALLFDKAKGILAFPVSLYEIPDSMKNDPNTDAGTYGNETYQGVYVYNISLDGISLQGRISHYTDAEYTNGTFMCRYDWIGAEDMMVGGSYWCGEKDIDRAMYIGDYYYTISPEVVQANKMSDLSEVNQVTLAE
ncbi:MAG: beta-propeller domain-containing protein [Candidatus Peregrinibacteria bacterium]|nr:beta-propeller domain-containing protein [Candidatus Peregrinibacteria bacterium]